MRNYYFEEKLRRKLSIVFKKDPRRYTILIKKIEEIITSNDIDHYKNLRKPLQNFKRVHINTHFVLVFKYEKNKDVILFYDFDHHDKIYKNS
jgi:YafQ family addiction module toxin component